MQSRSFRAAAVLPAWLACLVLCCRGGQMVSAAIAAPLPAPTIELAKDKQALLSVVIGPQATASTKETAKEFAQYLSQISGATFAVEVGDGTRGIALGRPGDFAKLPFEVKFGAGAFEREDYVLRSHAQGLYLLGATDAAVSHASWDLLHRLGYRQFFPGQTWEVVPTIDHIKIAINERQSPSFYARRIWYDWGVWGYNDEPYRQWCLRNRAAKGFDLQSGHAYDGIVAANKAEFDKHPEYFALIAGERKQRGDPKFCVSNEGLRKLVVDHAVRAVRDNPKLDSISMDPSDGGGWCECDACAKMGGVSDRVVTLANEVAVAINGLNLGDKYVGMYAYNQHSAPPKIKVHPRVIPSATTAFIGEGLTFDQVVAGWQAQGATMGVYDYLSVVDWDWNLPRGGSGSRLSHLAEFIPAIHRKGVRFYDAQSGDCWGPCGLGHYVASRVLWNIEEGKQLDALIDDFLDKAFGSAKPPMREFYRLITEDKQRRPPSDMIGRMYRKLDEARRATTDKKVLARIDDLILYTRYAEMYYAYAAGGKPIEPVAQYAYRIRKTMMVHSYGLWSRLISQQAALTPNHPLKSEEPFTPGEIDKILTDGIANNAPVDPGFATAEFSRKLVPAARLKLPKVSAGSFPTSAQDHQQYFVWLAEGEKSLDVKLTVEKVWTTRAPKISLYSPLEVTLDPVATFDNYKADGKTYEIKLSSPHAGLHRVEAFDGGDYTRIAWPEGVPVTIETGIDTHDVTSHFRGDWTLYFYVPKGAKLIGGWASRIANWAPRISGKLLDPDGKEILDFATVEEGWFKVPVPAGQDGKLWRFENSQGQRLLMTVPPYLARSAEELLLPAEVVEADAKK